jgi:molecular chaperone HtpG
LNATSLNPNASREAFQEDEAFEKAREGLEQCLRNYLLSLAKHDQRKLQELVGLHFRAIKVLAADDDEFYRLFIDWLPFETSQGEQTIKALRADGGEIVYVSHIDMFRQMAQVAAAQSVCLVNAGYVCDVALLEKLPEAFPELTVRRLDPSDLLDSLQELRFEDQEETAAALAQIERILARFQCRAALKRFRPADLPALYTIGEDAQFSRDVEHSKQAASDMWAGMLDNMHGNKADARSQLCFNWDNPVVRKILRVRDREVLRRTVELLYVQALLQGHYPLSPRERAVLSEGLTGLIDLAVQTRS